MGGLALQAEVASVKAAMQKRVEEAVAETEAKAGGLRDAREKNVHFSARVVALNARVAQQQKDIRNLTAINASLTQELEELRSHRLRAGDGPQLENGDSFNCQFCCKTPGTIACCCLRSWSFHGLSWLMHRHSYTPPATYPDMLEADSCKLGPTV